MLSSISPVVGRASYDNQMLVSGAGPDEGRTSRLPTPGMDPHLQGPTLIKNSTPTFLGVSTADDAYLRLGSYTPETDVGEIPPAARPDISLYCDLCQKFTALKLLSEHRSYHRSLEVMHYRGKSRPESVETLRKRRSSLLRKMKSSPQDDTINPAEVQRLNAAFEFLKSDLEDTFDAYRRVQEETNTDVRAVSLNCSTPCAPAMAICSDGNERWKSCMEDTRVFQDYFGNDPQKSFFALYDGHHGRFAAEVAANELHHSLLTEMEKFDPRTKCTCTFNMAENYDISEYEFTEQHSRAPSRTSERGLLHEASANVIQQIIRTCHENVSSLKSSETASEKSKPPSDTNSESKQTSHGTTTSDISKPSDTNSEYKQTSQGTTTSEISKPSDTNSESKQTSQGTTASEKSRSSDTNSETKQTSERATASETSPKKRREKKLKDPFCEKMAEAFRKAHRATDSLLSLGKDEMSRVRWSGCSTLTCVIQNKQSAIATDTDQGPDKSADPPPTRGGLMSSTPKHTMSSDLRLNSHSNSPQKAVEDHGKESTAESPRESAAEPPRELGVIHLANAGNVQAVLVRGNRAYRLSRDHTPNNTKERTRVIKEGGLVNESEKEMRVNGVLATTRGLGNHGDPGLKRCVVTDPYTTSVTIDQYAQFLILATDGVWQVLSDHEASSLLLQMLPSNRIPAPSNISSSVNGILADSRPSSQGAGQSEHSIKSHDQTSANDSDSSYKQVFGMIERKSSARIDENRNTVTVYERSDVSKSESEPVRSKTSSTSVHDDLRLHDDLQTEIGSRAESTILAAEEDSGNEADIETDILTLPPGASPRVKTRGEAQRELATVLAERLVQAALLAGSRDNITVMVVLLPACGV